MTYHDRIPELAETAKELIGREPYGKQNSRALTHIRELLRSIEWDAPEDPEIRIISASAREWAETLYSIVGHRRYDSASCTGADHVRSILLNQVDRLKVRAQMMARAQSPTRS